MAISVSKIFIINPQGEIKQHNQLYYKKSYPMINELVDTMFPSIEVSEKNEEIEKCN